MHIKKLSAMENKAHISKSFIGHKDRTFDLKYSQVRKQLLSASEDGTCKIWDASSGKCLTNIVHNKDAEVLRTEFLSTPEVGICSGGSDGNVILWSVDDSTSEVKKLHVLQHGPEAQIYVCESPHYDPASLIVAAENYLVLWDLETLQQSRMFTFHDLAPGKGEVQEPGFGGHRNPENNVFVFDGKTCPIQNEVVGVALSDSTIRMVDYRAPSQEAYSIIHLARQFTDKVGHATSLSWGADANHMTVSLGSGQVAVLDMRMFHNESPFVPPLIVEFACLTLLIDHTCSLQQRVRALLRGHDGSCYGSTLIKDGNVCVSWSSDCTVRTWDVTTATGICQTPLSVQRIPDFPILTTAWDAVLNALYCGGGGGSPGGPSTGKGGRGFSFIGAPIHMLLINDDA